MCDVLWVKEPSGESACPRQAMKVAMSHQNVCYSEELRISHIGPDYCMSSALFARCLGRVYFPKRPTQAGSVVYRLLCSMHQEISARGYGAEFNR